MSLKHAALGLLSTVGPSSGYDLLQLFQSSLSNVWPATQSQLYTELGKMAKVGLVTVIADGARGRKAYTVTDAGRAELQHWMTEVEPAALRRNDMLLRVFFLNLLDQEQAEAYLRGQMVASASYRSALEQVKDGIKGDTGPLTDQGRIALEWGLRLTTMQQEWAEWALEQLQQLQHSTPK